MYQGAVVDCIGKLIIDTNTFWWVVHLPDNVIGTIYGPNAESYYPSKPTGPAKPTPEPSPVPEAKPEPTPMKEQVTAEKQKMLDLINEERAKAGVSPLSFDMEVMEVAQVKSDDMVKNNYFSHTSPTYGSPFEMLDQFGVKYSAAGENLAKNVSVEAAHEALMNSEGHRKNILDPNYNCIGIGITNSSGGNVYVQMFIKKDRGEVSHSVNFPNGAVPFQSSTKNAQVGSACRKAS